MRDPILSKYALLPGFPFDDWADEITSFHALLSFWSDIFKADVTGAESEFHPMLEIKQQAEGPVFAVISRDGWKGFRVTHVSQSRGKTDSGFFVTGRIGANFETLPGAFILDVATDLAEQRICVIRTLLQQQLNGPERSLIVRDEELDAVITAHPELFPSMVETTRAFRTKLLNKDEDR